MAKYDSIDGYLFGDETIYGLNVTLKSPKKVPVIAKRIYDTLEHAQLYVDTVTDTAIPGLVLSVIADGENNGLYFVREIAQKGVEGSKGVLERVGGNAKSENVSYDNSESKLLATNVQDAIDELKNEIKSITGESGSVQEQINAAIGALDVAEPEGGVEGKYVSKVTQTDGQISVSYENLPEIPNINPGNGMEETIVEGGKKLSIKIAEANENNFNSLLTADENGLSLSSAIDFGTY